MIFKILFLLIFFLPNIAFPQNDLSEEDLEIVISHASNKLELDEYNFQYLKIRGAAYQLQGNYKKAILDFRKALTVNKKDKEVYSFLGDSYAESGNYEASILAYTSAIEIDDKYLDSYLGRAYSYRYNGQYKESLVDLNKCLNICGETFKVVINLGATYLMLKDYSLADKYLIKADSININNPYVYFYRSILEMRKDNFITMCIYYEKSKEYGLKEDFNLNGIRQSIEARCK